MTGAGSASRIFGLDFHALISPHSAVQGDEIVKLNSAVFGPGDLYCSMWHILSLGGLGEEDWTPQYSYWKRPQKLDDGGLKIIE